MLFSGKGRSGATVGLCFRDRREGGGGAVVVLGPGGRKGGREYVGRTILLN